MFIYHFNRLIRNRFVWGFFAVIISIAFASAGLSSCEKGSGESNRYAGRINRTKIPVAEFENTARAIRGFGNNRDNELSAREVVRRAWEQLAAVEVADRNGMPTGDGEIQDTIRDERAFQGPNGFDLARYREILRRQGMTPSQFEAIVARQIAIMKNAALVEASTWVAPMEIEDEVASMTDRFTVRVATLSNRFANAEMSLTEQDYRKFYEENKASFALPDRVSVRYVAVPVSNYLAFATVDEEELQNHYDRHATTYMRTTTNNVSEPIPFAEVRGKILDELKFEAARYCAETSVTDTIYGTLAASGPNALSKVSGRIGLEVKTSPLFSAEEPLFWVENAKEFATAAFSLDAESEDYRHALVPGQTCVYLIEAASVSAAHTPTFEQVLSDLKPRAQAKARADAFQTFAKTLRAELRASLDGGQPFAAAAQAKALNVSTSITFTVSEIQNQRFENSFTIAYGAMALKKGELSEAVPASAAQALLIYVESRQPGDSMTAEMIRAEVRTRVARRRYGSLFSDWLSWNLSQQDFKPTRPLVEEDEEAGIESGEQAAAAPAAN